MFGHQALTSLDFTCTIRTEDGRGSGWVKRSARDLARFDAREAADVAIEKALRSVDAKALEPGRYTVILEPAATSDLLAFMMNASTRAAPTKAAASCRKPAARTAWATSCSTSR